MRLSRRAFGAVTGAALGGLAVGCSKSQTDLLGWLRGLDGVRGAVYVTDSTGISGRSALVTTTPKLPDTDVVKLVHKIRSESRGHEPIGGPLVRMQVDNVQFPVDGDVHDQDLKSALWLRNDQRVLSAINPSWGFKIIARQPTVADVALDFDRQRGPEPKPRHEVRSADGWTGIGYSDVNDDYDTWSMDRGLVSQIAELQQDHPGIVLWTVLGTGAEPTRAGFYFDATIGLDQVRKLAPKLTFDGKIDELDLGWGPARSASNAFSRSFAEKSIKKVLAPLVGLPGIAELRIDTEYGDGIQSIQKLVVRNGTGYRAGLGSVRRTCDSIVRVDLVREPNRKLGEEPYALFSGRTDDTPAEIAVYDAAADLSDVQTVSVSDLTVKRTSSVEQLRAILMPLHDLLQGLDRDEQEETGPHQLYIFQSVDDADPNAGLAVGVASAKTFAPALQAQNRGDDQLIKKIQQVWADLH